MGSFDPFHVGHCAVIDRVLRDNVVDNVLITISPGNPWKSWNPISLEDRRKIIELSGYTWIDSNSFPSDPDGKFYSYRQLEGILERYRFEEKPIILGGADVNPREWKNSEWILDNFGFYQVPRLPDSISSTKIRELIKEGLSPLPYISEEAYSYILERSLYK